MSLHDFKNKPEPIEKRVSTTDLLPDRAVKEGRNTQLIRTTEILTTSATTLDGNTFRAVITSTSNVPGLIVISTEFVIYVDGTTAVNALVPRTTASTVDLSDFEIIGPFKSLIDLTNTQTLDNVDREIIMVKNVSGAPRTIYAYARVKYMMNRI